MSVILVIEDESEFRSMIKIILQMEGYDVLTAADGHSGLALVRANDKRPDLILCDIMMPGMDGHAVLEALKADRSVADIPFIFVTGFGEREQIRSGMAAGADDYLPKPFTAQELLAAVAGRLRRHELIRLKQGNPLFQKEKDFISTRITRREREVLIMVGHGVTSKKIADILHICPKTVEVHRSNLMKKLGVANAVGLARWAAIAEQVSDN